MGGLVVCAWALGRLLASLIFNDWSARSPPNASRRAAFSSSVLSSTPGTTEALSGIARSIFLSAMFAKARARIGQQDLILHLINLA